MWGDLRTVVPFLVLAFVLAGCATTGERQRTDSSRISSQEIRALTTASTLYDVVQQLRPRWLEVRAGRSLVGAETAIVVVQGQTILGGIDTLRQFSPDVADTLEYMDGPTASAALSGLGGRHVEGAIVIRTAPRR